MNSVLAQLKVVLDGLAGTVTDKQQEILGRASEKIKSLADLATELLDLASIESGLIIQEKEKLNFAELLKDQVIFYQSSAQEKAVKLELSQLPELPPVLGNRQNMEEILSNLITNAINYTPEGGRVAVSAREEKNYLCISLSDNGIGISEEDLERIFNRFYRVKNEKTRYIMGTGLGLAIVKSIAEAHNCVIGVESRLDEGSTFFIYVPLLTSS
ncbi:sensor histidine kinase [Thermodesulfobacteriota bacterium]